MREMLHFSSTNLDGAGDADGDGVLDFFEYLFQSDPNVTTFE